MAYQKSTVICSLIAIAIVIIGLVCFGVFYKKPVVVAETPVEPVKDDYQYTDIHPFTTDFTPIDMDPVEFEEQNNEDFGMYTGALDTWLSHHPSGSSVDRYTTNKKRHITDVSSVNNAVPQKEETESSQTNFDDFITHN